MPIKKNTILTFVSEYPSVGELPAGDKRLVAAARKAANDAYSPYSHFSVGAAVLLANGKIFCGNNQENSAYPSGLCAERVALFFANANFPKTAVKAIAIFALNKGIALAEPVTPCGSCRQVMLETEIRFKKPIRILLAGRKKILMIDGARSLLPLSFTAEALK
jgi:cytidine deaminase